MTQERRYREDEVAEIFEQAAASRPSTGSSVSPAHGLTLAELQAIGQEVGVAPERIAAAASTLDGRRNAAPRRTWLGMPISAGRQVDLPRAPTDREWQMLVGELRQTFRARGNDRSSGGIREWTNGNLHAYVEPTETGYRLRLGTMKGNAASVTGLGVTGMLLGVLVFADALITGGLSEQIIAPFLLGTGGASALAYNAVRLPRWAREREEQMEHIAERAAALITANPET